MQTKASTRNSGDGFISSVIKQPWDRHLSRNPQNGTPKLLLAQLGTTWNQKALPFITATEIRTSEQLQCGALVINSEQLQMEMMTCMRMDKQAWWGSRKAHSFYIRTSEAELTFLSEDGPANGTADNGPSSVRHWGVRKSIGRHGQAKEINIKCIQIRRDQHNDNLWQLDDRKRASCYHPLVLHIHLLQHLRYDLIVWLTTLLLNKMLHQ